MAVSSSMFSRNASRRTWPVDLLAAFAATLLVLLASAASGFQTLPAAGDDNDSLLRLVEVRDLLAGQGWFDLHQYRMGPEGGFVMHWSRLVDGPLALIVLAARALTGSTAVAEAAAELIWPALLYCLSVFCLVRAARLFGGEQAVLPGIVIAAAALFFIGIYQPGALDHHNFQLMLTAAALLLLMEAPRGKLSAFFAGACTALTLAVGMETAPYVAVLGATVAVLFLLDPDGERRTAIGFGLGLAGVCAAVFASTIPFSAWGAAACDAFSSAQFMPAAIAGIGLAAIAWLPALHAGPARRLLAFGALGIVLAAVVVWLFPQCLASPYAGIDPLMRELWLDHVEEAQSLRQLLVEDPGSVAGRYATPLLALLLMAHRLFRGRWRRQDSLVGAMLVAAFAVSVWQVRGSTFSIAFAVIPLAAWVAVWRERGAAGASRGAVAGMLAAWLASVNLVWGVAAAGAAVMFDSGPATTDDTGGASCKRGEDFAALAALPPTTVLAISNLGSPILAYSGHRVLAGPYHRNVAGNMLTLEAFIGSPDAARAIVTDHHVGLVALCQGNTETGFLAGRKPDGLLAALTRGEVPSWLEPIEGTAGQPLRLYRVRPSG